ILGQLRRKRLDLGGDARADRRDDCFAVLLQVGVDGRRDMFAVELRQLFLHRRLGLPLERALKLLDGGRNRLLRDLVAVLLKVMLYQIGQRLFGCAHRSSLVRWRLVSTGLRRHARRGERVIALDRMRYTAGERPEPIPSAFEARQVVGVSPRAGAEAAIRGGLGRCGVRFRLRYGHSRVHAGLSSPTELVTSWMPRKINSAGHVSMALPSMCNRSIRPGSRASTPTGSD